MIYYNQRPAKRATELDCRSMKLGCEVVNLIRSRATQQSDRYSMHDKNISPVGWYVCAYLLRFIEVEASSNEDPDSKFLSWENTVLIKASSIDEAYEKTTKIAKQSTNPYKGGPEGIDVQWVFEGVIEVLPIYEELADGAEIMWCERTPRKLKNLRRMVRAKHEFAQ